MLEDIKQEYTCNVLAGYLPLAEMAKAINKSARTVSRLMNEPDGLPHIRIGRTPYFNIEQIRVWLFSRGVKRNPTLGRRRSHGKSK